MLISPALQWLHVLAEIPSYVIFNHDAAGGICKACGGHLARCLGALAETRSAVLHAHKHAQIAWDLCYVSSTVVGVTANIDGLLL